MKLWVDKKIPAPDGYVWCKFYGDVTQNIYDSEARFGRSYRKGKIDESLLITEINIGTKFTAINELLTGFVILIENIILRIMKIKKK